MYTNTRAVCIQTILAFFTVRACFFFIAGYIGETSVVVRAVCSFFVPIVFPRVIIISFDGIDSSVVKRSTRTDPAFSRNTRTFPYGVSKARRIFSPSKSETSNNGSTLFVSGALTDETRRN